MRILINIGQVLLLVILLWPCSITSIFANNENKKLILWSWQRTDKLNFIDPKEVAIAPLIATIFVGNNYKVYTEPRINHLITPKNTIIIPVFRLEIKPKNISDELIDEIVKRILSMSHQQLIQLDFDAKYSQRNFYKKIIENLITNNRKVSITALASFCTYDRWLEHLPIEYAVPMLYRSNNSNDASIIEAKNLFNHLGYWPVSKCHGYIGLLPKEKIKPSKFHTIFIFNNNAWDKETYLKLILKSKT